MREAYAPESSVILTMVQKQVGLEVTL